MLDVVLCGNVRSEVSLFQIIREVCLAREQGLVRHFVFSTWATEVTRFPNLEKLASDLSIELVLLEPPAPYSGSLPIQHMQMWRGLQALPDDDVWVLRTRTEKAHAHTPQVFAAVERGYLDLSTEANPAGLFSGKVVVPALAVNDLFSHIDIITLATKQDFRRLLNVDAAYDYLFKDSGYFPVEARWFLTPIRARYPQLTRLFEQGLSARFCATIAKAAAERRLADAPDDVFALLVAYWRMLSEAFDVYGEQGAKQPDLGDLLSGAHREGQALTWGNRVLVSARPLAQALSAGRFEADPLWPRLRDHVESRRGFGEVLSGLDAQALLRFCDDIVGKAEPPKAAPQRMEATPGKAWNSAAAMAALQRADVAEPLLNADVEAIERTLDHEKREGGGMRQIFKLGSELAAEARLSGDRAKTQAAFQLLMCAAWGRIAEAVDEACLLAFEGLVGDQQRQEIFSEPVYTIHVQSQDSPIGHFWYGVQHIEQIGTARNAEFGWQLVQRAADMGFERAKAYSSGVLKRAF